MRARSLILKSEKEVIQNECDPARIVDRLVTDLFTRKPTKEEENSNLSGRRGCPPPVYKHLFDFAKYETRYDTSLKTLNTQIIERQHKLNEDHKQMNSQTINQIENSKVSETPIETTRTPVKYSIDRNKILRYRPAVINDNCYFILKPVINSV